MVQSSKAAGARRSRCAEHSNRHQPGADARSAAAHRAPHPDARTNRQPVPIRYRSDLCCSADLLRVDGPRYSRNVSVSPVQVMGLRRPRALASGARCLERARLCGSSQHIRARHLDARVPTPVPPTSRAASARRCSAASRSARSSTLTVFLHDPLPSIHRPVALALPSQTPSSMAPWYANSGPVDFVYTLLYGLSHSGTPWVEATHPISRLV
ncbi:hypothethical protein [Ralstonia solanacearum PSI07]|nr:hypothethical protein [Ralstonia solanacearum PSI07]